jgi:hypothetical protein
MKLHRKFAATILIEDRSPPEYDVQESRDIAAVVNFFEKVGMLVDRDNIDEELVYLYFDLPLLAYGHKIRQRRLAELSRQNEADPLILIYMENLFERILAVEIRTYEKHGATSPRVRYSDTEWASWSTRYLSTEEAVL